MALNIGFISLTYPQYCNIPLTHMLYSISLSTGNDTLLNNNKNMSTKKAILILEHLKQTHQYFCFVDYDRFYTAEELLAIVKQRPVSYDETIEFLTA